MKIVYLFPILTACLLIAFYAAMPQLHSCELPKCEKNTDKREKKLEILAISLITVVYAAVAFYGLGDRVAPETGLVLPDNSAEVLELEQPQRVSRAMSWSIIGTGSYTVEGSMDGMEYFPLCTIGQDYAQLLRWQETVIDSSETVRYVRISGSGEPEMGEFVLYGEDGEMLTWAGNSLLTDEQWTVPEKYSYLNSSYFDEIYHARTALEHIRGQWPYEISHPPLGKLIISLGIRLFGVNPFGWRFMGTLFGVLMLPIMYIFVKKLFGGRTVPTVCCTIFATDFMHFVQTRIATIDTYAVFFILLMYLFMYMYVSTDMVEKKSVSLRNLALSGLFFGLGAASKWTCIYAGAGLAVIWLGHRIIRFVKYGIYEMEHFVMNCLFCVVFFVFVPEIIYYVSYYPYGKGLGLDGFGMFFTGKYAMMVLENQVSMFSYHSGVTATHPYSSMWYQWVLDIRPILYYLDYGDGTRASFGAWVNPVLCWGGLFAVFTLIYTAIFRRDRKAAFILVGYLAQLVPWIFVTRVTFEYHYFPCAAFLVIAFGYVFSIMRDNLKEWKGLVWSIGIASGVVFCLFYPELEGLQINSQLASSLFQWLPTWPF